MGHTCKLYMLKTEARFVGAYAHQRLELPWERVVKLGKGSDQKPAAFLQPAHGLLSPRGSMEVLTSCYLHGTMLMHLCSHGGQWKGCWREGW